MKNKKNFNIEIIDDYLKKDDFKILQDYILSDNFPWFYYNHKVSKDDENFQFAHIFHYKNVVWSNAYSILENLIQKIDPIALIKIKANLTTKTENIIEYPLHVDYENNFSKTMIYYINTNNGYTYFENLEKIQSIENRAVFFSTNIKHSGSSCTDEKRRVLLNINYFEKQKNV